MLSPLRTPASKKHTLLGSAKFENWGSSGFRTKKQKRDNGAQDRTEKPIKLCGRVEPDLELVQFQRKTMDARIYKSMIKLPGQKDRSPGSTGVSTTEASNNMSVGGIKSCDVQKSLQNRLKPDILKLCQVLQVPEDVQDMIDKFLKYVISKHDVSRDSETKLEAFRISLCWNAASIMKYKINKKESLLLARQHLLFCCSAEEVSEVDSTLRKLGNTFAVDGNYKQLDSSKQYISEINKTKKDSEQPPKSHAEEKVISKYTKRVDRKLEKRMKKLAKKQEQEIVEFHRIWGQRKAQILQQHRQKAALLSPKNLKELNCSINELKNKLENHNYQKEIGLKDLEAYYSAKRSKEIGKKARWLEEMKSSRKVENPYMEPCNESANHETGLDNFMANSSEINTSVLHNESSSVDEVRENDKKELVGNDSGKNIVAKPPSSEVSESPSSVAEVVKSAGVEYIHGLHGSNNVSHNCFSGNNFIANRPSSEVELPHCASPSIKEVMNNSTNELFLHHKLPQPSTCPEMANKEAPAQKCDKQIPIEAATSDKIIHNLVLSNSLEKQQPSPTPNIPFITNQPISPVPPPPPSFPPPSPPPSPPPPPPSPPSLPGSAASELSKSPQMANAETPARKDNEHIPTEAGTFKSLHHTLPQSSTCSQMSNIEAPAQKDDENIPTEVAISNQIINNLVLSNPLERQQQPPSPPVITNQPPSPPHNSDHRLILENPPPSANIPFNTNRPISISASVNEQIHSQESYFPSFPVNSIRPHPIPASTVELESHRERPIVVLNMEASRQMENSQLPPSQSVLANIDNNFLVNSQTRMGTASSINSYLVDLRLNPMLQGARQTAPQTTAQRLTSNPLYNEYERLCRESERVVEVHENMKLQLKSDCEKELAEIRKKYDLKLHQAETAFSVKKKELDINSAKVFMSGLIAQSFQNMAEYRPSFKDPQDFSSNLMQQVHPPHSQPHPIFPPSNFTNASSPLSAFNIQNNPRIFGTITPQPNFHENGIQAPPDLQHFRPQPPFSANNFSSSLQRAPAHQEPPRQPIYQPIHFGSGYRPALRNSNPSLENISISQSGIMSSLRNQIATQSSSFFVPIPASSSNNSLLSQVMAGNNGGSNNRLLSQVMACKNGWEINNMGHSGRRNDFICLSDDE